MHSFATVILVAPSLCLLARTVVNDRWFRSYRLVRRLRFFAFVASGSDAPAKMVSSSAKI